MPSASPEHLTVSAADGKAIAARRWIPAATPRAVVQIAHGMAEHGMRYHDFAAFLAARGFAVYAHDHRGHGDTAEPGKLGHFADADGWPLVVSDLEAVRQRVVADFPAAPIFVLGHSMGSFVVRAWLLDHPDAAAGAILSATGFEQRSLARLLARVAAWDGRRRGFAHPSRLMEKLVFGSFNLQFFPARTPFAWLSRDPAVAPAYLDDPRCGFACTPRLWMDLFGAIADMETREQARPRLPPSLAVLLVAGSRDPVSMGGKGVRQLGRRYRDTGLTDVTVGVYRGGRHELLNETNRAEVFADVARWMEERLAR